RQLRAPGLPTAGRLRALRGRGAGARAARRSGGRALAGRRVRRRRGAAQPRGPRAEARQESGDKGDGPSEDGACDDGVEEPGEKAMNAEAPKLSVPPGACDTHIHFYDAAVPAAPGTPMPGTFAVADYAAVQKRLGLERVVVVQPSAYAADNTVTLNAMAALGAGARGIAVVKASVPEAELDRLTKAGMRGVRFMTLYGGTLGFEVMDRIAARVRPFGWHSDIQLDG